MTNEQENKEVSIFALGEAKKYNFLASVKVAAQEEKKIVKILDTNCYIKIADKQNDGDKTLISGKLNVFVTYESTNKEIVFVKGEGDCSGVVESNDCPLVFEDIMANCKVDSYDENFVNISASIETQIAIVEHKEVGQDFGVESQLELNKITFDVTKVLGSGLCSFEEQIEQSYSGDMQIIKRQATCVVDNAYAGVDAVTIEGNIFVTLLLNNNDAFQELKVVLPYKQETECFGANPGSFVNANVFVSDIQVGVKDGENESKTINVVVQAGASVVSLAKDEINNVVDAYSVDYNTKLTLNTIQNNNVNYVGYSKEDVDFSINIDGRIGVDEILCVVVKTTDDFKSVFEDDQLKVIYKLESVVYYRNNNDGTVQTFVDNCNNTITIKDEDGVNTISNLKFVVEGYKFRAGNTIDVSGKLYYEELNLERTILSYVSAVEFEQESNNDSGAAIKMHVVRQGETLFDIAKELKVSQETLVLQNEDLLSGVVPGEKIYVYLPLSVNFE